MSGHSKWSTIKRKKEATDQKRSKMFAKLLRAIEDGTLGAGSVAGDEYLRNMSDARLCQNGNVRWVEVCFCDVPLDEERPYWEEFFELVRVQDAHARSRCRDLSGTEGVRRMRLHRAAGSTSGRPGPAVP